MRFVPSDHYLMVTHSRQDGPESHTEGRTKLFVGEWIRALGFTPREVSKGAKVNEGYLSSIISGKKFNPTNAVLSRIAAFLGLKGPAVFYEPPPPAAVLAELRKFSRHFTD